MILDKLFVFVLVLDRLDHPQNPPPAALLVLLALVTLWGEVTVSAASVEAMADPEEVLFSHEGKREETRCMIATVYSNERKTSPSSPSSPGGVRQRGRKGYRDLGREVLNWTGQQAVVAVMTKVEVKVEVEAVEGAATGGGAGCIWSC